MFSNTSCVNFEDFHPRLLIWQWNFNLPVQPPRTKECRVQNIRTISRHDHFYLYKTHQIHLTGLRAPLVFSEFPGQHWFLH
ncbi:Os06g0607850 [Oryza sativa Japonica Group]|uniref:Os06g0607850 protein n=1 Tax=Oryza sativa subsp. japonica TaxID=39947 RepID=A0A0N7KMD9_ORYSJ|nr:hypothetical protein EE612_035243 [Oryza sativa]BAS98545.1 Os06g0607850 [Oryza sativa Japonica Group]